MLTSTSAASSPSASHNYTVPPHASGVSGMVLHRGSPKQHSRSNREARRTLVARHINRRLSNMSGPCWNFDKQTCRERVREGGGHTATPTHANPSNNRRQRMCFVT
jgi:hypothetical protein